MQHHDIDSQIATIIYGSSVDGFRPSRSERDAWIVVDWMLHHNLNLQLGQLNPAQICQQFLRQLQNRPLFCA